MDKNVLEKHIEELKATIKETDELIQKAFETSVFMMEPFKTQFVNELHLKQIQLDARKGILKSLEMMAERD